MSNLRRLLSESDEYIVPEAVLKELEGGANPNEISTEEGGVSAMHLAAGRNHEILGLLLQYGGDPNVRSREGMTPLHVAASYGHLEILNLLLHNGADTSIQDEDGYRALDFAKDNSNFLCLKELKLHTMMANVEDCSDCSTASQQNHFHNTNREHPYHHLDNSFIEPEVLSCKYADTITQQLYNYLSNGRQVCFDATSPNTPLLGMKPSWCNKFEHLQRLSEKHKTSFRCNENQSSHCCEHQCCHHTHKLGSECGSVHHPSIAGEEIFGSSCSPGRRVQVHSAPRSLFGVTPMSHSTQRNTHSPQSFSCDSAFNSPQRFVDRHASFSHSPQSGSHENISLPQKGFPGNNHSCCSHQSPILVQHQSSNYHDNCSDCHGLDPYISVNLNSTLSPKHSQSSLISNKEALIHDTNGHTSFMSCHSLKNSHKPLTSEHSKFNENSSFHDDPMMNESRGCPTNFQQKHSHKKGFSHISRVISGQSRSNAKEEVLANKAVEDDAFICVDSSKANNADVLSNMEGGSLNYKPSQSISESKLSRVAEYVLSCTDFSSHCCVGDSGNETSSLSRGLSSLSSGNGHKSIKENLPPAASNSNGDGYIPKEKTSIKFSADSSSSSADSFCTAADNSTNSSPNHIFTNSNFIDPVLNDITCTKEAVTINNLAATTLCGGNNSSSFNRWKPPTLSPQLALDESSIMTSESSFFVPSRNRLFKRIPKTSSKVMVSDENRQRVKGLSDEPSELSKKRMELGYNIFPRMTKGGTSNSLDDSLFSSITTEEYVYTDPERGITLLEKRIPTDCGSSIASRRSLDSINSKLSQDSQATIIYDWKTLKKVEDAKIDTPVISNNRPSLDKYLQCNVHPSSDNTVECNDQTLEYYENERETENTVIPAHLEKLSNKQLSQELEKYGEMPGPVIAATRQVYLKRLASLESEPGLVRITKTCPDYPRELRQAMNGSFDWNCTLMSDLEAKMVDSFAMTQGRQWREGCVKSSFTYLLLDPRVTQNLPLRAKDLNELEVFKTFICAIFYIGKGKRARPYCHLYEAISKMQHKDTKTNNKVQHILDIWGDSQGVISLHCFQSVIPVEAYTREACMLEAIGMHKVTNVKKGNFYGVVSTWAMHQRKQLGVSLLHKAMTIFLAEGERQICPVDLKSNSQ